MSRVCVGNDVVDLANPRTAGRSADERFTARVLAVEEREAVRASSEPDLELWCHWAAKEAGYKALSKLVGQVPPFVHRTFEVSWTETVARSGAAPAHEAPVIRRGAVLWRGHRADVSVALHGRVQGLHATAHVSRATPDADVRLRSRVASLEEPASAWAGTLDELLARFTEREADAVYSLASAAVRLGARAALAEALGVAERRIEIVCAPGPTSQRPPRVLLDGGDPEADVSLSHDGPLVAWTLWVGRHAAANPDPEASTLAPEPVTRRKAAK